MTGPRWTHLLKNKTERDSNPSPSHFSGRCRSSQRLRAAVHVGQLQVRDGQLEVRHDLHLQHSHEPDRPGAAVRGRVPGLLPPAEIHHELAAVAG